MSTKRHYEREFVRTFFTTPTVVEGESDSAKMLRSAAQVRGIQAPDVWVPDNEDATAPTMRAEGVENIIDVVAEHGSDYPSEIVQSLLDKAANRTVVIGFEASQAVGFDGHNFTWLTEYGRY